MISHAPLTMYIRQPILLMPIGSRNTSISLRTLVKECNLRNYRTYARPFSIKDEKASPLARIGKFNTSDGYSICNGVQPTEQKPWKRNMTATSPYTRLLEALRGSSAYIFDRPPMMNRHATRRHCERRAVRFRPQAATRWVPTIQQPRHHTFKTTFQSVSFCLNLNESSNLPLVAAGQGL